jgi:hypothetical protein
MRAMTTLPPAAACAALERHVSSRTAGWEVATGHRHVRQSCGPYRDPQRIVGWLRAPPAGA